MGKIKKLFEENHELFDTIILDKQHYKAGDVEHFFIYPVGFVIPSNKGMVVKTYSMTNMTMAGELTSPKEFIAETVLFEVNKEIELCVDLKIYCGYAVTELQVLADQLVHFAQDIHWKRSYFLRVDMMFKTDVDFDGKDTQLKLSLKGTLYKEQE